MKKLTIESFVRSGGQGSFGHTFTYQLDDGEIVLESCMNGYCVGIYDDNLNLVGEKVCTNIEGMMEMQIMPGFSMGTAEALPKAVEIANKLLASSET